MCDGVGDNGAITLKMKKYTLQPTRNQNKYSVSIDSGNHCLPPNSYRQNKRYVSFVGLLFIFVEERTVRFLPTKNFLEKRYYTRDDEKGMSNEIVYSYSERKKINKIIIHLRLVALWMGGCVQSSISVSNHYLY